VLWTTTLIVAAGNLGAFGLLAWAAVHGDISLAALAVYVRAAIDATGFRAFDDANMILAYAAVSVPSMLALEQKLSQGEARGGATLPPDSPHAGIRFEGVTFRYPGQTAETLAGFDLDIPAGRSLAIVGANGAGKTTLVKLVARLYDPQEGQVLIDGRDVREYDPDQLRGEFGVLFQDYVSYQFSARENIGIGRVERLDDTPAIAAAAVKSGASSVIEKLPEGYDTVLGKWFDGGVNLSGGEWQKVALGRAFMREAQILILDEPSAALDAKAEYELFSRLQELAHGRTAIFISHRFSTVRRADRILVFEHGSLIESGTHEELLALGGRYAELFNLQAASYR
jgi:ATP-binding cassette subfamily B protein